MFKYDNVNRTKAILTYNNLFLCKHKPMDDGMYMRTK